MKAGHVTVLLQEAISALNIKPDGFYVDCTYGRGGHSKLILSRLGGEGRLLALDKDKYAVRHARQNIKDPRFNILCESFVNLPGVLGKNQVDGVLLDLGVSSPQLDDARRGFSFAKDGPLDMRMDQGSKPTAADWLNSAEQKEIADVLWQYGEERKSRTIAREIVKRREIKPFTSTLQLASCIRDISPKYTNKHPATRTFQAIRIFINQELAELKELLGKITDFLKIGARLVVISFHSLEDRIVKKALRAECQAQKLPKEIPLESKIICRLREILKIKASPEEINKNPRARSAIMRVAERQAQ